ncbi:MAG: ornithine carbamoyltransferase subunit F [Pseudonocardiales bacterium]|nr:ornithine carbamoyltransferase subunit F [Pseudonocardiales bacterium]
MAVHAGSLLKELDLDKKQFLALLDLARELKRAKADGTETPRLTGKNIALVFEKASTRTRCAFEVAAHDQGAHVTYLGPEGSHIGREESIADVLTMTEHHEGGLEGISFAFLGDGRNNVARSLLVTGALLGMDVRIAAPRALWPPEDVVTTARVLAAASGATVLVTDDATAAVQGVDFVYTDVWVSMGESAATWATRVPMLTPYRVTRELMAATGRPDTKFLHCLPSVHDTSTDLGRRVFDEFGLDGAEVADEVFSSWHSIVFDQAENRLHTIKAVLVAAYAG